MDAIAVNRLISGLAARQKGLVTRAQLRGRGVGRGLIAHRVKVGLLFEVYDGVYAVGHPNISAHARWLAACWTYGKDAALSDVTAAALWRILPFTEEIHVTVPTLNGRASRGGIKVCRRVLPSDDVTTLHGVPVTTLIRTVIDLAATQPLATLERAFEQAQIEYHLSPATLEAEAVARKGRRGTAKLKAILRDAVEPGLVESILELRFLQFCRDQQLPRPLTQVKFGRWRADFFFPESGVVVETDGRRFHSTAARKRKDAEKTADLEAAGFIVVRLRWADVVHRPHVAAARVREALERGRLAQIA
jgi:very-short-patch-repair endonuclease